jgi:hypothetical protein
MEELTTELSYSVQYAIKAKIRARNLIDWGLLSEANTETILTAEKPSAPSGLKATITSSTSVLLTWNELTEAETGYASIEGYRVYGSATTNFIETVPAVSPPQWEIHNLTPADTLSLTVAAVNKYGYGDISSSISITVLFRPSKPLAPTITSQGISVLIEWQEPSDCIS